MRTTKHCQLYFLAVCLLAAVTAAGGCGSSGSSPDGGGGASGHGGQAGLGGQPGQAGAGGMSDAGGDGIDAAPMFMAFAPCTSESTYVSNTTEIDFGGTLGLVYSPSCLKIAPGTTLTYSGDFVTHPLTPSVTRSTPGNPIVSTASGTTASFTFSTPGFYGFFCLNHGDEEGEGMSGVIWVQ